MPGALESPDLCIGDLNVMTSMISTVVMGAGIDAGIHFFLRARKERRARAGESALCHERTPPPISFSLHPSLLPGSAYTPVELAYPAPLLEAARCLAP